MDSESVTATRNQVLSGYTALTKDSGDEAAEGTMANRGAVSHSLPINGSYTIPQGYHNGSGKVSQSIATQGAIILNPGTTAKKGNVSGKYMTGNITVPAISIPAAYIKKGQKITFPDGSSVTGTFEGWVPLETDLFYNGVFYNGASKYKGVIGSNALIINSSTGGGIYFGNLNVNAFKKLNVAGEFQSTQGKLWFTVVGVTGIGENQIIKEGISKTSRVPLTVSFDISEVTNLATDDYLGITGNEYGYEMIEPGSLLKRVWLS